MSINWCLQSLYWFRNFDNIFAMDCTTPWCTLSSFCLFFQGWQKPEWRFSIRNFQLLRNRENDKGKEEKMKVCGHLVHYGPSSSTFLHMAPWGKCTFSNKDHFFLLRLQPRAKIGLLERLKSSKKADTHTKKNSIRLSWV